MRFLVQNYLNQNAHKQKEKPLESQQFQRFSVVREAGLEPARPEWTLEPESSESANSTTRAYAVF